MTTELSNFQKALVAAGCYRPVSGTAHVKVTIRKASGGLCFQPELSCGCVCEFMSFTNPTGSSAGPAMIRHEQLPGRNCVHYQRVADGWDWGTAS